MNHRIISKLVRAAVGCRGKPWPIVFVDGFAPPRTEGRAGRWTTPGGKPVYYPRAYRGAFGRPVYHPSTVRIVVGIGWLIEQLLAEEAERKAEREALRRSRNELMRVLRSPVDPAHVNPYAGVRFTAEGGYRLEGGVS